MPFDCRWDVTLAVAGTKPANNITTSNTGALCRTSKILHESRAAGGLRKYRNPLLRETAHLPFAFGQLRSHIGNSLSAFRVNNIRCDLAERFENKSAVGHCRMGNLKIAIGDDLIAEKQDIDIDRSRSLVHHAVASELGFNLLDTREQLTRAQISFQLHSTIQEPGLITAFHRLGFKKGRGPDNFAQGGEANDAVANIRLAIPEV